MKPITIGALVGLFSVWAAFMFSIATPVADKKTDSLQKFMNACKDDLSATMTVGTFQNSISVHCSKIYRTVTP